MLAKPRPPGRESTCTSTPSRRRPVPSAPTPRRSACALLCRAPATWCTCPRTSTGSRPLRTTRDDNEPRRRRPSRTSAKQPKAGRHLPHDVLPAQPALPLGLAGLRGTERGVDRRPRANLARGPCRWRRCASTPTWRRRRRPRSSRWRASGAGARSWPSRPPARGSSTSTGVWRYTRGLAFSATARPADAQAELEALRGLTLAVSPDRTLAGFFKTADMLRPRHPRPGRGDRRAPGADRRRRARADGGGRHPGRPLAFTEPPPWYYPVRQSLGAALLQGGRPVDAEAVYREDLRWNPGTAGRSTGWPRRFAPRASRPRRPRSTPASRAPGAMPT